MARRTFSSTLAVLLSTGLFVGTLAAQNKPATNAAVEVSRLFRQDPDVRDTQAASVEESQDDLFAPSSPGDDDVGIQQLLQERERVKHWLVFGEVGGFYTSNVLLLNQAVEEDSFLVTGMGVSFQQEIGTSMVFNATAREQFFRYNEFSDIDFDSFNITGQLTYVFQEFHDVAAFVRYNYNILTQPTLQNEFFNNHTVTFGAQKSFMLSRAHYWYAGADALLSWADPSAAGRNEYGFFLGYTAQLTRALTGNIYYRFGYFDYDSGGRHDVNNTVSVSLAYTVWEYFTLSGGVSANWNNSNINVFDYQVVTPGGSLQAQYRF